MCLKSHFFYLYINSGNSAALRKRYDSLHAGVKQKEQLLNRAVARRNQFDDSLAGFVDPLSKLEARLAGSDSEEEARNLKDKMEGLQVSKQTWECKNG